MRIAITGASGMIGTALADALTARGDDVLTIGRGPDADVRWEPMHGRLDVDALEGVDVIVHLAAEPLGDAKWTPERCALIRESRVRGTGLIAGAATAMHPRPRALLSASASGWYGDRGDEDLTETSPPPAAPGFLASVCHEWEDATAVAEAAGVRTAHLRVGSVLAGHAGVLASMVPLVRLGVAGPVPPGTQYVSWISLDDAVGAVAHVIDAEDLAGPVNVTAPVPVTNAELTATLAHLLGTTADATITRAELDALFGAGLVGQVLVEGRRALPARLLGSGYRFRHPRLADALRWALP